MKNEIDALSKAIAIGAQAVETLQKSHVKEHTRTSASGAVSQVSAYDDKRKAAEKASKAANDSQARHTWDNPRDTRVVAANHADAAHAHVEALKEASTHEQIRENFHAASRHLQSNDSMHTFANGNKKEADNTKHARHAEMSSEHAKELSDHANSATDSEDTSEGLDKKSSLHLLAMEQHQRAASAHMKSAGENINNDKKYDAHTSQAQHHYGEAKKHGKEVQRVSSIAISARDKAYAASDKAKRSGTADDHKSASIAHHEAARLDYDSEGKSEHKAKAAEHAKKAGTTGLSDKTAPYLEKFGDKMKGSDLKEVKGWVDGIKTLSADDKKALHAAIKQKYYQGR